MELKGIISALESNGFTRKIFPNEAPQGEALPYVVAFIVDSDPQGSADSAVEFQDVRIQLSVFASTYEQAVTIDGELFDILNDYTTAISGLDYDRIRYAGKRDLPFEPDLKAYHRESDYQMIVNS
jgi:hypothetical protein